MLIRSQDKRMIVNFENICTVSAFPEKGRKGRNDGNVSVVSCESGETSVLYREY